MDGLAYISFADWITIGYQVFGGCCSNVFVLENLITNNQLSYSLGSTITFCQFLIVTILSYYPNSDFKTSNWKRLYLKPSKIPIWKWVVLVCLYFLNSLMNNLVWKYNISIPLHIIFRSSGTVVTMVIGYLFGGKTYNYNQILSSVVISFGTILATVPPGSDKSEVSFAADRNFIIGISILFISSVLAAFMALYNEGLYQKYGNQWQEGLFYSHFLSLPLFLVVSNTIYHELGVIIFDASRTIQLMPGLIISKQLMNLIINVFTQFMCIKGVSMLAGRSSALTVSIVLLVRKFVSLFISILWYGNSVTKETIAGAIGVFGGAAYYSLSSTKKKSKKE